MTELVAVILMSIAFGMGLGLGRVDFETLLRRPWPVFVGLVGQILLLPAIATAVAWCMPIEITGLGILLIGACPGGSSSNYMTYLARGDVALSVLLTALSGSLSVLYVPVFFNLASGLVAERSTEITLPVAKTMTQIFLYAVAPVVAGMLVRHRIPKFADRAKGWVAGVAFAGLLALTPFLVADHFGALVPIAPSVVSAVSVLLAIMMPLAYGLARVARLPRAACRTVGIEVGVQNVALAIFLGLRYFDDPRIVAVPIGYLIVMYVFVPGFVVACRVSDAQNRP